MATKDPSIAPRLHALAPSPIAIASSPPSADNSPQYTGSTSLGVKKNSPSNMAAGIGGKGVTQIITSKEWVLPPRPKPGRKPSVDTPASKRKAQNRAAQRAFRERRAGRVQELEEKLLEVEKERDVKEMGLVNTINKLKVENQFLLKSIEQLRSDMNAIRNSNSGNRIGDFTPQYNSISHYKSNPSPNSRSAGSPSNSSSYSVQQISPAPSADSPPFANITTYNNSLTSTSNNNSPAMQAPTVSNNASSNSFDCGVCVKEECLCESVGLKDAEPKKSLDETLKDFKPVPAVSLLSRKRKFNQLVTREIDFTRKFATNKPMPDLKKLKKASTNNAMLAERTVNATSSNSKFDEASPVDNCGFCSDDTPCVCREAAKEAAKFNESLNVDEEESNETTTSLPPIQINNNNLRKTSLPVMHPGPSVEIREITNLSPGAVPTVVAPTTRSVLANDASDRESPVPEKSSSGGCTGNPGTCEQCQMDPMSTLFCTTVANKVEDEERSRSKSPDTDSKMPPARLNASSATQLSRLSSRTSLPSISVTNTIDPTSERKDIFIPCSDAYRTLSRHKKFNSVDFSTLVGKLTTRGMQVEVQSVANVLRELDRRVYN